MTVKTVKTESQTFFLLTECRTVLPIIYGPVSKAYYSTLYCNMLRCRAEWLRMAVCRSYANSIRLDAPAVPFYCAVT
jgi:hypothetical protein